MTHVKNTPTLISYLNEKVDVFLKRGEAVEKVRWKNTRKLRVEEGTNNKTLRRAARESKSSFTHGEKEREIERDID